MELVEQLARARIGATFNQYARSELLRERLARYLDERAEAEVILVGEAAGYRGARVSGIAFTSERQLTGAGPAEASATIVQRVLDDLGVTANVLLWNVVPTHPGTASSNRRPTRAEVDLAHGVPGRGDAGPAGGRSRPARGRRARSAYVRHPSHWRRDTFAKGLGRLLGAQDFRYNPASADALSASFL